MATKVEAQNADDRPPSTDGPIKKVLGWFGSFIDTNIKPWTDRFRAIYYIVAAALVVGGGLYWYLNKDAETNKIAIILPLTGPDSKSGQEILAAAKLAFGHICETTEPYVCQNQGRNFELVEFDDEGDPAVAERLARQISQDDRFIAVIGHFSSSITKTALDAYCEAEDLTILMPVPTATDITSVARTRGCRSVLRIPPSNRQQANDIVTLLGRLNDSQTEAVSEPHYLLVFRDQSNPEYSNNLGTELLSSLSNSSSRNRVALDIGILGNEGKIIVTDSLDPYENSSLVIIGMTESALQSLRQAKVRGWRPRNIILTDGAVSEELQINGDDVLDGDVFMLFQTLDIADADFDFARRMAASGHPVSDTSFAPYGYEAVTILASIIEDVSRANGRSMERNQVADYVVTQILGRQYENRYSHRQDPLISFSDIGDSSYLRYTSYRFDPSSGQFVEFGSD